MNPEKALPLGKARRSGVAAKAAFKMGAREAGFRLQRSVGLGNEQEEHERKQAQTLFSALSHLRGTALKAAQLLSQDLDFLPETYREELGKAFYQVPRLNRSVIRKAFVAAFGEPPERLFDTFEPEAFAAASLGQVHGASLQGNSLAIKIQYPGIGNSIKDDMLLLRRLHGPIPQSHLYLSGLEEIEARISEEVDYRLEAERTQFFREHLVHPLVVIPKVYPELSTNKILATERLEGLHLKEWLLGNPSQGERDRYGQLLIDQMEHSLTKLGRLHIDPNPGNFLFMSEGRLGMLDFGCVKGVTPDFSEKYHRLINAAVRQEIPVVLECYRQLDLDFVQSDESLEHLKRWCAWYRVPYLTDFFDLTKHPGYIEEGFELFLGLRRFMNNLNKDMIFLDRTWLGLYRILESMQARVNFQVGRLTLFDR